MRYLHHPNVIRLHDVFYIKQKMYLVVDLCDKGDVFDVLSESQRTVSNPNANPKNT